jgi:hypothetical protein
MSHKNVRTLLDLRSVPTVELVIKLFKKDKQMKLLK